MALHLQQVLVDVPIANLKAGESARTFVHNLSSRLGIPSTDLQQQFHEILCQVFASALGFWICDYVAVVCADGSISSSDPEEHTILQPAGVLAWCQSTTQELQHKVVAVVKSGATTAAQPDHIIELGRASKTLLAIAEAVRSAMGSSSAAVDDLIHTLQLLQQTTQVLQWLEQQQQQRPGQQPLIARSVSSRSTSGGLGFLNPNTPISPLNPVITNVTTPIEPFGPRTAPSYVSLPAWQQNLTQLRKDTMMANPDRSNPRSNPQGRLFLDDLVDRLLAVSEGQRVVDYPYPDVLGCVEGLFLSGSSSRAWRAKLAVLLYYLLDGGWITSAAPFAQGFQLPLTLVQQWQCHYLMDHASSSSSDSAAAGSSSNLDEACKLLGAIASPATPFRFVEALLSAGRPATALAVQRARCATSGGGSAAAAGVSLSEAHVLLKVQLGCGLLPEAFSKLRRHCSQLPQPERDRQLKALIQQLADWAAAADKPQQQQQQQQQQGPSRLQQLIQLPYNAEEECALLGYFKAKMVEGNPVGYVVPLYLLQRGRSLEALKAYADYQASPVAAAAAANSEHGAALQRQLQTVMSAAAAALPANLRSTAVAAGSGSSSNSVISILAGLGVSDQGSARSAVPAAELPSQGIEQPTFMTQLVPASVAGDGGILVSNSAAAAASDAAPAVDGEELPTAAAGAHVSSSSFWRGFNAAPAAAAAAAAGSSNDQFPGSLFGNEVAAAAGPGAVALAPNTQGVSSAPAVAADGDYVPLLFGTPAPGAAAARAGQGGFSGFTGTPGFNGFDTPGGFDAPGFNTPGFNMSEEEFSREVLGVQGNDAVSKTGRGGKRTIKRQKQTPGVN